MNFVLISAFVAVSALAKNLTLSDVYGEAPVVQSMKPWHERSATRQQRSEKYHSSRAAEECNFALEIYILQDNTASFQDNYVEMKNTQIPLLVEAMNSDHPGTAYGIMSFRDKPIWSLGDPRAGDYCQIFESPLSGDDDLLTAVYDRLISTGGGDPSECQFGGLVAACQSETPGWSNPDAVKLIVMATDAPPHFADDGLNAYGMTTFSGTFDEANADTQCLQEYYPSPGQVRDALVAREAYLASIIFDSEYLEGLVGESWQWFNSYVGQTPEFVEPLGNNSTTFWGSLSRIIETIKDIECAHHTSSTEIIYSEPWPTTTPVTTTPGMTTSEPHLTMTISEPECPPTGPCHCHGHKRCPEVVIKLAHRPKRLRLEVEN